MADADWKKGDVVMLKSGSPKMTVSNVGDSYGSLTVWCVWFEGSKKHEDTFAPELLQVPPKPASRRISMI